MKKNKKNKGILPIAITVLTLLTLAGCGKASNTDASVTESLATEAVETTETVTTESVSSTEETTADASAIQSGGEFTYGLATEINNFDPFDSLTADTRKILFNIFEGLVKPTTDGGFIPAVAESYTISEDALTYTFVLRSGIKFHNGKDVTTEDVLYSV